MTELEKKLHVLMKPGHSVKLTEITEFQDNWNNSTNLSCKHAYNIEITHDDDAYKFVPSRTANKYYKDIEQLYKEEYPNGEFYLTGFSECGGDVVITVMKRIRKAVV